MSNADSQPEMSARMHRPRSAARTDAAPRLSTRNALVVGSRANANASCRSRGFHAMFRKEYASEQTVDFDDDSALHRRDSHD